MKFVLPLLAFASVASAGLIYTQPLAYHQPIVSQPIIQSEPSFAHPAVVQNAAAESQLPEELKSNIYKNPHIAAALAKESWFGDQEMPVFDREADKIPREQVYKLFKNAGFVRRR